MGTVGQFSVIFLPAFAHNSNEIYCRCSITQNIVKKRQPLFLAPPFLPSLNHFVKHATLHVALRPFLLIEELRLSRCLQFYLADKRGKMTLLPRYRG